MTASQACNYLQNAAATTYKKFLQFYAKRSCKKHTPSPSLKNISTILKNGQDKVALTTDPVRISNKESSKYGITRGASYYKGGGDRS